MAITSQADTLTRAEQTATPLELPLADPLGASILTTYLNLYSTPNGTLDAGVWETDTGRSRWEFTDNGEVIYVISGRMTVTEDGAEPVEIGPGTLAVFPVGWVGYWEVTEPLKKVYVIYR